MTSPDKGPVVFPSATAQATLAVQVPTTPCEGLRIQCFNPQSCLRDPPGGSPGTAQMSPDLVARVACLIELSGELVEVETGRTGAQVAEREWVFEVGGQYAVLLSLISRRTAVVGGVNQQTPGGDPLIS
jgi:hypothetical protein